MPPWRPASGSAGARARAHETREEWVESGRFAVELLCRTLERKNLSGVDLLDVGCGTKIVKTLLDNSMPIGRYVGIDASAEVIDWLKANVSDPRFEFHRLNAHNAMYNPEGRIWQLRGTAGGRAWFDLICLFSVFTHLAPHDYVAMLRLFAVMPGPTPGSSSHCSSWIANARRNSQKRSRRGSRARIPRSGSEPRRRSEGAGPRRCGGRSAIRRRDPRPSARDREVRAGLRARARPRHRLGGAGAAPARAIHPALHDLRPDLIGGFLSGQFCVSHPPLRRGILRGRCRRRTWRSCARSWEEFQAGMERGDPGACLRFGDSRAEDFEWISVAET